jgi:hypothetical protein
MRRPRDVLGLTAVAALAAALSPVRAQADEVFAPLLPLGGGALTDDGPGMAVTLDDDTSNRFHGAPPRHRELNNRVNETNLNCGLEKLGYCDFVKSQGSGLANWLRTSGGTGTANTGPDAAYEGNFYAYTEANGNAGKSMIITLDVKHEFRGWGYSFRYFMFGNQIGLGSLSFLTSPDNTVFTSRWSKVGEQQTSGSDGWGLAEIQLSDLNPKPRYLQFIGVRGSGNRADLALDDFRVIPMPTPAPTSIPTPLPTQAPTSLPTVCPIPTDFLA